MLAGPLVSGPTPAILDGMPSPTSALNPDAMAEARALLKRPERAERMWPALGAAALLALSALVFATAMIVAPPLVSEHVAPARGGE
jgi:hypothetical protein